MKLLLDEMLPRAVAEQLRARSHDAVAVTERTELRGLSDRDLLARAQDERRAIATCNVADFLSLDREYRAAGRQHSGVVLISPRRVGASSVGPLVRALDRFLTEARSYPSFVRWLQ